jgi:hypothetical protein
MDLFADKPYFVGAVRWFNKWQLIGFTFQHRTLRQCLGLGIIVQWTAVLTHYTPTFLTPSVMEFSPPFFKLLDLRVDIVAHIFMSVLFNMVIQSFQHYVDIMYIEFGAGLVCFLLPLPAHPPFQYFNIRNVVRQVSNYNSFVTDEFDTI